MPNGNGSFAEKVAFVTGAAAEDAQRIRIRMGDQTVTATLNSSEATRDLIAMLPLSIRMRDHLRREKTRFRSGQRGARPINRVTWAIGGRAATS
jgi:hypothetical protein